ncbi:hypothetical protein Misp06_00271 [Microbulbifer sp. NBRC 101763]|uniref:hypothetical protein n=1 Tax=Microbulbifer sp. NBRC 101763 TaxID=1113820 RepID=UPI0030A5949A
MSDLYLIKNAHCPCISFEVSKGVESVKRRFFSLKKKDGYGIKLNGRLFALIVIKNKLFLLFKNCWYDVSEPSFSAKVEQKSKAEKSFSLLDGEKLIFSFDFSDRELNRKDITPEPHFVDDVVDWLKDDASRKWYKSLFEKA